MSKKLYLLSGLANTLVDKTMIGGFLVMENTNLTLVQKLFLQALKEGPKDSAELTRFVRDELSKIKDGGAAPGMSGRAQAVLQELEKEGYILKIKGKLFGAKKFELTEKGKQIAG
ncbi:MAG: hypothetical protein KJN62_07540 [Deltaproteobacteria bacterium]|nr:hypothetical protein [Deltaproteobacteria bacterium]